MPLTALSGFDGLGDAPRLAETILALMPDTGILVIDTDMRFVLVEGGVFARHGYDTKTFVGRDIREVIPAAAWSRLGELWIGALAGEPSELDWESVDTKREYWLHFVPLRTRADRVVGALGLAQDITERVRARAQVLHRLTLQGAVSSLGSMALGSVALDDLLPLAARVVHDGLGTDLIVVLEHTAEGAVVRASAGEADPPSPDELRFDGGETFLSHDLRSEARFQAPGLEAAGMRSLIAAPIGSGATGFGSVVACSRRRAAFARDDKGFVESIANVLMSAVGRARAVARAAEAETRMSQFWELSLDPLAILSSDGRFVDVSRAWEQILGWTPEELIGRPAQEFFVSEDRPGAGAGEVPFAPGADALPEVVNRFRAKDGSFRWLLWSVRQAPDGSLHAVAKDITERHEDRELARRREEQLNDAQRLAGVGSWELDLSSGELHVSRHMREMLALDASLSTAQALLARVHPADRGRVEGLLGGDAERFAEPVDVRTAGPGGSEGCLVVIATPVRDDTGGQVALRGTVEDVTAERSAAEALRRSEERFSQGFDHAPIGMALTDPRPCASCASMTPSASWWGARGRRCST